MNARRNRLVLWSIAGLLAASAVLSLAGGVLLPYEMPHAPPPAPARAAVVPASAELTIPPLDAFAPFREMPLRRPLMDEPPAAEATTPATMPAPAPEQAASIRLAGTVVEPGHSYAILVTGSGQFQLKAVGENVDGDEVLDIREDAVTIRHDGQVLTLNMPRP